MGYLNLNKKRFSTWVRWRDVETHAKTSPGGVGKGDMRKMERETSKKEESIVKKKVSAEQILL